MEIKTNTKVENNKKVQTNSTKIEQEILNSSVSFAEEIKGLKEKENENHVQSNSEIDDKSNVKNDTNQNVEVEKDNKEILETPNKFDINYNFNIKNKNAKIDKENVESLETPNPNDKEFNFNIKDKNAKIDKENVKNLETLNPNDKEFNFNIKDKNAKIDKENVESLETLNPNDKEFNFNIKDKNVKNNKKNLETPKQINKELNDLKLIVEELNVSKNKDILSQENDEKLEIKIEEKHGADKMFNNVNSNEPTELLNAQMNMNMNSNGQGQSFGEFLNQNETKTLGYNEKELSEEAKILSTMEENLAMINQNMVQQTSIINNENNSKEEKTLIIEPQPIQQNIIEIESNIQTVINSEGIKKVDKNTNITKEVIVKHDDVVMTKNDVEFFNNLVNNNVSQIDGKEALKSLQTSKNLSDLLLKAMNDNQPIRINFDNNISIIIKISREGKLSVDFLPSSQIAEAYLKENLPLLKQKFDENNIEYDELNQRQREQRQDERNNKQKKGRKDE